MATRRPLVLVAGRLKELALGDRAQGAGGVIVSDTVPAGAEEGAEWFDTTTGLFYVYVGTSWVGVGASAPPAVPADGTSTLSWLGGKLVRVDYPDGAYLTLSWTGAVLTSAVMHRAGSTRTTDLTWLSGVLQSVNTTTV